LELAGFEMMKGAPAVSHGMSADLFSRYEMVLSGHYHTKSSRGNIHYLGVPYEITWADCNDPKYFHILDTNTRELSEIRNPLSLFKRLTYDDTLGPVTPVEPSEVSGTYIKVVVTSKKDPYAFDKYIDSINAGEPFDLKIVESFVEYSADSIDDESIEISDTSSLLNSYVDAIETDLDKTRIKSKLQELYLESQLIDGI
jgi:DNA repair exonuclease SbcCD nuclease subunit